MKTKLFPWVLAIACILTLTSTLNVARADSRYADSGEDDRQLVGSVYIKDQDVQLVAILSANRLTIHHTGGKSVQVEIPKDRDFDSIGLMIGPDKDILIFRLDKKIGPTKKQGSLSIKAHEVVAADAPAFLEQVKELDPLYKPRSGKKHYWLF